jgi:hypothetical protein
MYLRDEAVLAMASILGTHGKFYSVLVKYTADNSLAFTLAMDEADSSVEFCRSALNKKKSSSGKALADITAHMDSFHKVIKEYMENRQGGVLSRWIMELPDEYCKGGIVTKMFLGDTVVNDEFNAYNCLRLLIVNWAAQELRIWAAKLK